MSNETKHLMKWVIAVALIGILMMLLVMTFGGEEILTGLLER